MRRLRFSLRMDGLFRAPLLWAFVLTAPSLLAPKLFAKTVASVGVSPQGAVMQRGATLGFSATCTYSDSSTDDCSAAGGVTWSVSRPSAMTVTQTGAATITADPGARSFQKGYVMATVGSQVERAAIYTQHRGDTWYQYMTPDYRSFKTFMQAQLPTSAVVGSTIALGSGVLMNYNGAGSTGQPVQDTCNWSSSAPNVATVDRQGHVTGISPGTATITCGRAGNGVFGKSSQAGWVSPGNVITITVVNGGTSNQTWYVRPGGGTPYVSASTTPNGQCDGLHDADYPGKGYNQPCAVGNLNYLWLDQVSYAKVGWMISGGDTVIVRQKSSGYTLGSTTANGQPNCPGDTADCYMPTIPAGTAARHTRILGENYGSCHADSAKTKLLLDYGQYGGINLEESQFADVSCFEVTDSTACAYGNFNNRCGGNPHFGGNGVLTSALTAQDTISDLFIHGLAAGGFLGSVGTGLVVDHLHLRAMPSAGINMDDDPWGTGNISVAGGLALTNSITEFTGCVEEYPVVHNYPYIECRDQSTGGYGDGLGTASTSGDWLFDHDVWRYNFQDGLDLLHSGMHSLTVTNSQSYGNDGQQYKIGSGQTVVFANNIALHDCQRILQRFGDEPASAIVPGVTACRAAGDGILLSVSALGSDTFQNNTYVGYGSTSYDMFCEDGYDSCQSAHTTFENNVNVGLNKPSYNEQLPGLFYNGSPGMPANGGWAVRDHNLFYGFRNGCPTLQLGEVCADPDFVNEPSLTLGNSDSGLDGFNFSLTASSPAAFAGAALPMLSIQSAGVVLTNVLATDQFGTTRPVPPSMGAVEISNGSPSAPAPPSKTSTTLQLAVTPTTSVVGTTVTLTGTAAVEGGSTPTGTVTFTVGGQTLSAPLTAGTATVSISSLAVGNYMVTASYGGDATFQAASATSVAVSVTPVASAPPPPPPTTSNISVTVAQPTYGFNVIPGSVRRLFATVTNGTTNGVSWTVKSGSAVLSAGTGAWVDVTAPATGSTCSAARGPAGSVTSATQFVIEAASQEDATKVSDVTVNVCSPTVQVSIVPAYRTLYSGQQADLQSLVVGTVQTGVTWAVQSQPQGGDGLLSDSSYRDTVFTASVAGRYVVTATSTADGSTVASSTMYVTGNAMPYQVTKNLTEPVDCSVDPALGGVTYEVGPSQAYQRLANVPLGTLSPGSTVRLHNEDTTGMAPTTYNEAIEITASAQADQPVRLCGVPDSSGNLPILDGTSATMHPDVQTSTAGLALVAVGGSGNFYAYPVYRAVQNVAIEGIHLRNARAGLSYVGGSGVPGAWSTAAACVLVQAGHQINVTGVEMEGCGKGGQSLWTAGLWNGSSLNHLWEGNYIHGNGTAGSAVNHQLSLQAWGEVVQFNRIDGIVSNSASDDLKSRGVLDVIRYNYLGDGAAHNLNLAEVTQARAYLSFDSFMAGTSTGQFTADNVAAWQEALHSEFVYGNTYLNGSSAAPIHFGYDITGGETARKGDLFWYNNTLHQTACPTCNGRPWTLFDQTGLGGSHLAQVEFTTVSAFNNIVWMDVLPFQWNDYDAFIGVGGSNLLTAGWGADTMHGGVGDGWYDWASATAYQGAQALATHVDGFSVADVLTIATMPFDGTSWLLSQTEPGTTAVPAAMSQLPTRYAYLPASGYAVPRVVNPNIGAEDSAAQSNVQGAKLPRR